MGPAGLTQTHGDWVPGVMSSPSPALFTYSCFPQKREIDKFFGAGQVPGCCCIVCSLCFERLFLILMFQKLALRLPSYHPTSAGVEVFLALCSGEARKSKGADGGRRLLQKGVSPLSLQVFKQRQDGHQIWKPQKGFRHWMMVVGMGSGWGWIGLRITIEKSFKSGYT